MQIILEDIQCHHNWYPKQMCNLDLLPEIVITTTCNQSQILEEKETKQTQQKDYCNWIEKKKKTTTLKCTTAGSPQHIQPSWQTLTKRLQDFFHSIICRTKCFFIKVQTNKWQCVCTVKGIEPTGASVVWWLRLNASSLIMTRDHSHFPSPLPSCHISTISAN